MSDFDREYAEYMDQRIELALDALDSYRLNLAAGGASAQTGGGVKEYQTVGPDARHKLKGILQHYGKSAHPFTDCVRDNEKRFGARADNICAVVKDIIFNSTKWRGKGNPAGMGPHPYTGLSDFDVVTLKPLVPDADDPDMPGTVDDETALWIEELGKLKLPLTTTPANSDWNT